MIFNEEFSHGQVIEATGIDPNSLQTWLKRGQLIGHPGENLEGQGKGKRRRYTFFTLMEIAIANEIASTCGMGSLSDVFSAAALFAHAGDGATGSDPERFPGLPFPAPVSRTFIIAGRGWSKTVPFRVDGHPLELYTHIADAGPCVILNASEVFDKTLRALGYDPARVLIEAYMV